MIAFILLAPPNSAQVFQKLIDTHNQMSSSSVLVRDAVNNFFPVGATFTPTTGRLTLPTRRIVELGAGKARFYDILFGQVATESLTVKDPASSLIKFSPVHREPLGFLLDPSIRNSFLKDLSKAKGWTVNGSNSLEKINSRPQ